MSPLAPAPPESRAPLGARDLTQSVRADLDAIFAEVGPLPLTSPAANLQAQADVRALRPEAPAKTPIAAYAAAVAALAVGLSIGAVVAHAPPAPPAEPSATVRVAAIAPDPAPIAQPVAAAPAPRPAMIRPAAAVRPQRVKAGPDVLAADRKLRRAYDRAVRARVPRRVLVDYRDRWADLRQTDADRPAALVRGYGALAEDLGRAVRDAPAGRAEAMDPPPLRWPFWR